jgi:Tol biopolymer transport system component
MVGGKWIVVVDGEEVGRYDGTSEGTPILFSPNSQRVAYGAQVGDKWMVVVDGEEVGRYDGIMSGTPIFSPDSQHVVYVARVGDKWTTFLEGQERGEYDSLIDEPVFNEDGTWLAFTAQSGGNTVIVVNGHESALLGPSLRGSRIVFDDNNTIRALIVQGDRVYSIRARIK